MGGSIVGDATSCALPGSVCHGARRPQPESPLASRGLTRVSDAAALPSARTLSRAPAQATLAGVIACRSTASSPPCSWPRCSPPGLRRLRRPLASPTSRCAAPSSASRSRPTTGAVPAPISGTRAAAPAGGAAPGRARGERPRTAIRTTFRPRPSRSGGAPTRRRSAPVRVAAGVVATGRHPSGRRGCHPRPPNKR